MKRKQDNTKTEVRGNQHLWILGGIALLTIGGGVYWYYSKKKKQDDFSGFNSNGNAKEIQRTTKRVSRFKCTNRKYPLVYGTCHKDVEILQQYLLKIYQEDLGSTGTAKNGVDGMFGSKTARAAKKHLGKISFNNTDIKGMKTAIKIIKK